jgi:acyl-CoA synthetase (AMP-forming)/AMP-acid ligase II
MKAISEYRAIFEPLRERALAAEEQVALSFMHEDGRVQTLSVGDLYSRARQFASSLERAGIEPGDLTILVMHHSIDLLAAFLGASACGVVPSIFPYLTEKLDPEIYYRRVRTLIREADASALIVSPTFKADLETILDDIGCPIISSEDFDHSGPLGDMFTASPPVSDDASALLQYSSGATGLQKGVLLSHRKVLNQIEALTHVFQIQETDCVVSWLPLYHDMGLVAGFLLPLVKGIPFVLISPFHWVREPRVLFEAFDSFGGTLCWMPNFAFNHCARSVRTRDLEGMDLSHVRRVLSGSEVVRHESMNVFLERFGPHGLREQALATGYGMAEVTLAATVSRIGTPPTVDWVLLEDLQQRGKATPASETDHGATPIVSSGCPLPGTEVRVVNDDGEILGERSVGEIMLKSNSMFTEYYRRPEMTKNAFRDGWFFTRDMGYIAEGELYVLGRKDDLIIVGGRNIYPQDIEEIVNQVPGVYQGRAAAFGVDDERLGTSSIALVCELRGDPDEKQQRQIESEIRRSVVADLDVALADVRFVPRGWIVKTSNGKIARKDNREKYQKAFEQG